MPLSHFDSFERFSVAGLEAKKKKRMHLPRSGPRRIRVSFITGFFIFPRLCLNISVFTDDTARSFSRDPLLHLAVCLHRRTRVTFFHFLRLHVC